MAVVKKNNSHHEVTIEWYDQAGQASDTQSAYYGWVVCSCGQSVPVNAKGRPVGILENPREGVSEHFSG